MDTSSNSTGVAIFIDGELSRHFLIDLKGIKDTEKRLESMIKEIQKIIKEEKPDIITTELTVVTRNAQAQRNLTMILGAIWGDCIQNNIFYFSLRPTEWRSLVDTTKKPTGRKREDYKNWSMEVVKEIYGLDVETDDISDAILIGRGYCNKFG
jgi:Holliday junction resolvasome RuvABC endonuclease subunit